MPALASLQLVPLAPTSDGARLWLGAPHTGPATVRLRVATRGGAEWSVDVRPDWRRLGAAEFWTARVQLDGLSAGTRYAISVESEGELARVELTTLPVRLPAEGSGESFNVLLGSCFGLGSAKALPLGDLLSTLPVAESPHVKLLCGDQVYLDLPVVEDLPEDPLKLISKLLGKYRCNWEHVASHGQHRAGGFGRFLRTGSNLFVADDHEFWNNYPFAQAQLPITWRSGPREAYSASAAELYDAFQPSDSPHGFAALRLHTSSGVGGLDVFALDGRRFRSRDNAHSAQGLDELVLELKRDSCPAVLVLSQPLFDAPAGGWSRRWRDANLADFDDYPRLVRAICDRTHDVLVLSGDIHRARVASARSALGASIHEIVASPLSLIGSGSHKRAPANDRFPNPAVPGAAGRTVTTELAGLGTENFATIRFTDSSGRVDVRVSYWTYQPSQNTGLRRAWETRILLY